MKSHTPEPGTLAGNRLQQYSRRARSADMLQAMQRRTKNWSSFAMAAGSAAAFATSASAGIIYSGPVSFSASAPVFGGIDNQTLAVGGDTLHLYARHLFGGLFDDAAVYFGVAGGAAFENTQNQLKAFNTGSVIGSGNAGHHRLARGRYTSDSSSRSPGSWVDGNPRLAGFYLQGSSGKLNGWIRLVVGFQGAAPTSITALEWAYEDSGASIAAGDTGLSSVPEPGTESMAMLALGAGAVMALRRRRQALKNSAATE